MLGKAVPVKRGGVVEPDARIEGCRYSRSGSIVGDQFGEVPQRGAAETEHGDIEACASEFPSGERDHGLFLPIVSASLFSLARSSSEGPSAWSNTGPRG